MAQAHQNLLVAELHVGHVQLTVRKSGYVDLELPSRNDLASGSLFDITFKDLNFPSPQSLTSLYRLLQ